ncbi:MAG: tetratricopeptide repeat protein [Nitrospirales bacterium]
MPPRLYQRLSPWNILIFGVSVLIFGCSDPSEWDIQWREITHAMEAGHIQEAKSRLTKLLPVVQEEGPRNPHYAQVIFQLGIVAQHEGNHERAELYFWEALPLWAQSLGPEHLQMAVTLSSLSALFVKKGRIDTALPLLKRAVAIEEKAWGSSDPQRLPSLIAYKDLLTSANQEREAQEVQTHISYIRSTHPSE